MSLRLNLLSTLLPNFAGYPPAVRVRPPLIPIRMWHTKLISRHLGLVAILTHSQLSQRLSVRLTRFSDGHGLAICGDALAMWPTLQWGKPCNVANPELWPTLQCGQPCNTVNPAMWPILQCSQSCNVANLAMWQTLQCGQSYMQWDQSCNVPTLQCGQSNHVDNPETAATVTLQLKSAQLVRI